MNGSPALSLFGLSGRVALVTGGNGGIGLAMATGLAKMGARIVIAGRSEEKAAAALAKLRAFTPSPRFQAADMANADACAALVDGVRQREGRIDILINNAGTTARKRPEDLSLEEWKAVIDINLTSAFVCSKAAFPAMKANGGGKIINIGSMFSLFGAPFAAAYGASKGGLMQLTRSLATAWADRVRSTASSISADSGRISTYGARWATPAGPTTMCSPISADRKTSSAAPTLIMAWAGRLPSRIRPNRMNSATPSSPPAWKPACPATTTSMAPARREWAISRPPRATGAGAARRWATCARPEPAPTCGSSLRPM